MRRVQNKKIQAGRVANGENRPISFLVIRRGGRKVVTMPRRISKLAGLGLFSGLLLSGCATMPRAPGYVYYRVPCTTPGAIPAEPIAPVTKAPTAPPSAAAEGGSSSSPSICLLALSPASVSRGYYPAGYYGQPYYSGLGYGSAFFSIGHGPLGHGWSGGHHRIGGGHHNSGHGTGHH